MRGGEENMAKKSIVFLTVIYENKKKICFLEFTKLLSGIILTYTV